MINKKDKKGISPLIATVLIIGFTIVIAALVITWGTNLFKRTQEATGERANINIACTEVLGNMGISAVLVEGQNNVSVTIDNTVRRDIRGFVVRIYDASGVADTLDTQDAEDAANISPADFEIDGNNIKVYTVTYNETVIPDPVKVEFKPTIVIEGQPQQCPGEGVSREL